MSEVSNFFFRDFQIRNAKTTPFKICENNGESRRRYGLKKNFQMKNKKKQFPSELVYR